MNKTRVLQEFAKFFLPRKPKFKTPEVQERRLRQFARKAEEFRKDLQELYKRLDPDKQYELIFRHWNPFGPSYNQYSRKYSHDGRPLRFVVNVAQRRYTLHPVFGKLLGRDYWGSMHHLIVVEHPGIKPVGGRCSLCMKIGVKTLAFCRANLHWRDSDYSEHQRPIRVCAYHALSSGRRLTILKKTREYASNGYGDYYSNDLENIKKYVPASIPPKERILAEALISSRELRSLFDDPEIQGKWIEVSR